MDDAQVHSVERLDEYVQAAFIFDSVLHFFVEHHSATSMKPERDIRNLFLINIKTRFVFDVVTIIPLFQWFEGILQLKYRQLLYLVKVLRLYKALHLLNVKDTMIEIKRFQNRRIKKIILRSKELA
mmetsp:Transcript_11931/g.18415  ORF Transcript_11931/g.18415 Transcript_11931/m.18415 type:complete len:126 (-) Transcript_11931:543-920(-)